MLITNFDKKEEIIYREAVKRYGLNTLYVDSNAYVNGVKDDSMSALRCNDIIRDLTKFWEIFNDVKHNLKIINKYNICDRVLVKINYINDPRK